MRDDIDRESRRHFKINMSFHLQNFNLGSYMCVYSTEFHSEKAHHHKIIVNFLPKNECHGKSNIDISDGSTAEMHDGSSRQQWLRPPKRL